MLYRSHLSTQRSGVVLLVVMAMLSLFAIVGLSFVFFADAEAVAARYTSDAQVKSFADVDPEVLMAYALGQLIYDTNNPYSAMRGWSLARSMYGLNPSALNFTPYNGVGRKAVSGNPIAFGPTIADNGNLVNYQKFEIPPFSPVNQYVLGDMVTAGGNAYKYIAANPSTGSPPPNPAIWQQLPADPFRNTLGTIVNRTPEWWGKSTDGVSYRYVGGANPPYTAYDTNSLFLAEVDASGNVLMPSFYRSWHARDMLGNPILPASGSPASAYTSLSPDPFWNQHFRGSFYPLPDDPTNSGLHVKNLDIGPIGNDSRWMDLGFPIMTAPNGKRYKALFAPLIVDLSNRINLMIHGNQSGGSAATGSGMHVSSTGMGPTEVNNALRIPGVSAMIKPNNVTGTSPLTAGADVRAFGPNRYVQITTASPHGFTGGQKVIIAGVRQTLYNGTFTVSTGQAPDTPGTGPTPTTFFYRAPAGLVPPNPSGWGTVVNAEFAQLFGLKYNGAAGPTTPPIRFPSLSLPNQGGPYYAPFDFDGRGLTTLPVSEEQGVGTRPIFFSFTTNSTKPAAKGATTMTVPTYGQLNSYGGFHWSVVPGMPLIVGAGATAEPAPMTVQKVDYVNNIITFSSAFTKVHLPGTPVAFVIAPGVPFFNMGYDNLGGGVNEVQPTATTFNPLGFNPFIVNNSVPQNNGLEAMLRFGHTNSPAITSDVFRLMPTTMGSLRTRNLYSGLSWSLDRVASAPVLTFDRTKIGNFVYNQALKYPKLANAVGTPTWGTPINLPNSDFTSETTGTSGWRSTLSQQLRVDLNRALTDYSVNAAQALADRQTFARDIYNALIRVTGAHDPNVGAPILNTSVDFQAARWLAQLAVNIVDYVDADDNMTAFKWFTAGNTTDSWVFGTELPRVVLNEVYAQHETPTAAIGQVGVWAELFNPLNNTAGPYPNNNGKALLQTGAANPPYIIETHGATTTVNGFTVGQILRDPANSTGASPSTLLNTQTDWGTVTQTQQLQPFNGGSAPPQIQTFPITSIIEKGLTVTVQTAGKLPTSPPVVGQAVTITGVTLNKGVGVGNPVPGYEGTFDILSVNGNSFTYRSPVGGLPAAAGGTATIVTANPNAGFYVLAPAGARYTSQAHNPQLPATYASTGMIVADSPIKIANPNKNPAITGISHGAITKGGTTVTVRVTAKLPADFVPGAKVVIGGNLRTLAGAPANYYAGTFVILTVAANGLSFTYNLPQPQAGTLPPVPPNTNDAGGGTATLVIPSVTVLLRRLANPTLALNPNPASPAYNPYVTIDYVDGVNVNDSTGPGANGTPANAFATVGRLQPYTAFGQPNVPGSQIVNQAGATSPGQPQNTFFQKNNPGEQQDWLVQMDRPLINPLELLHVSGYKPHELTQQFKVNGQPFQHYAPWASSIGVGISANDQSTMLYRLLEVLTTGNHMPGTMAGGRQPGKININTITDPEIFVALCDPADATQPNPLFNTAQLLGIYTNMVASRNGGAPGPGTAPNSDGNPFQPLSAGNLNQTIFRLDTNGNQLFGVPGTGAGTVSHPYLRAALMQKIYNNVTTTSNCFAVWMTVGYFEVVDESVKPARLGQEIGRDQNRHVRHRFFSIIDRTGMELFRNMAPTAPAAAGTAWNAATNYPLNSLASFGGMLYQSTRFPGNTGKQPNLNGDFWSPAMTIQPANTTSMGKTAALWNNTTTYNPGDIVTRAIGKGPASAYICIQTNVNSPPTLAAASLLNWQRVLQPGMLLEVINPGGVSEVVSVISVGAANTALANTFTAEFKNVYSPNSTIICRGNPGPQATYNPRKDNNVVLHLSLIQ